MAKMNRYDSQISAPVQQAQLVNAADFPFNVAEARTIGNIGSVMEELGVRKRIADDALAANASATARDLAEQQMQLFKTQNPDPAKWMPYAQKLADQSYKAYAAQRFSPAAKAQEDMRQEAWKEKFTLDTEIHTNSQTIKNAAFETGSRYIEAARQGDASKMIEALEQYETALLNMYPPETARIYLEETTREGQKGYWYEQAILFPEQVTDEVARRKKTLAEGGEDTDGLSATEWSQIGSVARAASARRVDTEKAALVALQQGELDAINKAEFSSDWVAMHRLIESSHLTEEEQGVMLRRAKAGMEAVTKDKPIDTNWQLKSRLKLLAGGVERGTTNYKELMLAISEGVAAKALDPEKDVPDIQTIADAGIEAARTRAESVAVSSGARQIAGIELPTIDPTDPDVMKNAVMAMLTVAKQAQGPSQKLRWRLFDEYMDDIRAYIAKDIDFDPKAFYQYQANRATFYGILAGKEDEGIEAAMEFGAGKAADVVSGGGFGVGGGADIPTINTQAEFDALPKGAVFIDAEDGKRYRK